MLHCDLYCKIIVFCFDNCAYYFGEKFVLVWFYFFQVTKVEKKETEGKFFEAEAWFLRPRHEQAEAEKCSRGSLFSTEASKCLRAALLFSTKMPWDKSNYTRIIFSVEFKPEQLFQHDAFLDFLVFLWTFWPLFRGNNT